MPKLFFFWQGQTIVIHQDPIRPRQTGAGCVAQALPKHFPSSSQALPKLFPSSSQALPKLFPSSSQALPKLFPSSSQALKCHLRCLCNFFVGGRGTDDIKNSETSRISRLDNLHPLKWTLVNNVSEWLLILLCGKGDHPNDPIWPLSLEAVRRAATCISYITHRALCWGQTVIYTFRRDSFGSSQWDTQRDFSRCFYFSLMQRGPIGSPSNRSNVASIAEIISFDLHKPWVYKNLRGDRLRICHTYDCGAREPLPLCQMVSVVGASHSASSKLKRGVKRLAMEMAMIKARLKP
jgi:hypothetical protein